MAGSIARRKDRGNRWRATYRDEAGRQHARLFDRKVDAQGWLDQVTTAVVTGTYVDPKAGKVTFETYAKGWQASHVGAASTATGIDVALRLHIIPRLGTLPMGSVRRSHVQALVKDMSATHKPGTVGLVYGIAAQIFTSAVDDRVIGQSPCRKILLPRAESTEVVPPTVEEVALIRDTIPERYRAAVTFLAGSGLRVGELLGLRVADVDFLRRTVRVERQRDQRGRICPPKTASSTRTVPLGQVVVDALAAHLATFPSDGWLFTEKGGINPTTWRRWRTEWEKVQRTTKLDVSTHDLRHFFASALIAGGASVKQVQAVLGHANATTTLETYSHLWPGDDDRTRTIVDETLGVLCTNRVPEGSAEDVSAGQKA